MPVIVIELETFLQTRSQWLHFVYLLFLCQYKTNVCTHWAIFEYSHLKWWRVFVRICRRCQKNEWLETIFLLFSVRVQLKDCSWFDCIEKRAHTFWSLDLLLVAACIIIGHLKDRHNVVYIQVDDTAVAASQLKLHDCEYINRTNWCHLSLGFGIRIKCFAQMIANEHFSHLSMFPFAFFFWLTFLKWI